MHTQPQGTVGFDFAFWRFGTDARTPTAQGREPNVAWQQAECSIAVATCSSRVSLLICLTICFFHIISTRAREFAESPTEHKRFPKLTETSSEALMETNNNLRGGEDDKEPEEMALISLPLLPTWRCQQRGEKTERKKKKKQRGRRRRGNKVFMLGLRHAKLMAGLLCLARRSWYWEEMQEERGESRMWLECYHAQPNFTFLRGLSQREGSGGGYGKWCIHSAIRWLRNTLNNCVEPKS